MTTQKSALTNLENIFSDSTKHLAMLSQQLAEISNRLSDQERRIVKLEEGTKDIPTREEVRLERQDLVALRQTEQALVIHLNAQSNAWERVWPIISQIEQDVSDPRPHPFVPSQRHASTTNPGSNDETS